jgi:hypothetical protein
VFNRSKSNYKKPILAARLAQEHPTVYDAYQRGEYRSIRAAAEAAGLVPPGHQALPRLKSYWRKASEQEQRDFADWLQSEAPELFRP